MAATNPSWHHELQKPKNHQNTGQVEAQESQDEQKQKENPHETEGPKTAETKLRIAPESSTSRKRKSENARIEIPNNTYISRVSTQIHINTRNVYISASISSQCNYQDVIEIETEKQKT